MFDRKKWAKEYRKNHSEQIKQYQREYFQNNKEKILSKHREWIKNHPKESKEYQQRYYKKYKDKYIKLAEKRRIKDLDMRKKVMELISGKAECVRCGCKDIRILEINHKEGGGNKERKGFHYGRILYKDILEGKRNKKDLECLCKVCNIIHFIEEKYSDLCGKIKVIWN